MGVQFLCTVVSGCGKDRKTLEEGAAQGASDEPLVVVGQTLDPITLDNHVPPATFLVQSYDIENLTIIPSLEEATSGTDAATGLRAPQSPGLYWAFSHQLRQFWR